MLTPTQAATTLAQFEARAAAEDDGRYAKKFGQAWFTVEREGASIKYLWGKNYVDKHVALNVVQSFAESPKR